MLKTQFYRKHLPSFKQLSKFLDFHVKVFPEVIWCFSIYNEIHLVLNSTISSILLKSLHRRETFCCIVVILICFISITNIAISDKYVFVSGADIRVTYFQNSLSKS